MEDNIDFDVIKQCVEGEDKSFTCTENTPRVIGHIIELFLEDIIRRIQRDNVSEITPQDVANVIENTPEYNFLKPIIPEILKQ